MLDFNLIQTITLAAIPILFAITVHEVAHGYVAYKLGDPTAYSLGRLTINPIKHIDPIGTIIVPIIMLLLPGNFLFGWAKPVPISWRNLKNPRRDIALVAIAGPLSNLVMACFWAMVFRIGMELQLEASSYGPQLALMSIYGININLILLVLNLLPIPPLDGSRVLSSFLSAKYAYYYNKIEPYGLIILVAMIFTGVLGLILSPALQFMIMLLRNLFQLN